MLAAHDLSVVRRRQAAVPVCLRDNQHPRPHISTPHKHIHNRPQALAALMELGNELDADLDDLEIINTAFHNAVSDDPARERRFILVRRL